MEIDSALTAIQTLRNELQDAKLAAANAQLKPLPGENVRNSVSPVTVNSSFVWKKNSFHLLCLSWRNVLRTWAARPSRWAPPWPSSSPVQHKETSTTQVGSAKKTTLSQCVARGVRNHSDIRRIQEVCGI